jgi:predicted histidine transporter YuiF (NhaC family)
MNNFLSSPASGYILLGIIIGMFIMAFFQLKKDKSYKTGEEDAREKILSYQNILRQKNNYREVFYCSPSGLIKNLNIKKYEYIKYD